MNTTKKKIVKKPKSSKGLPGKVVGEINGFPVRRIQVGQITGASYNPRSITDHALEGLTRSTNEFGLVQAVVWNKKTQRVVGGHQRLKTLKPDDFTDVVEVDMDEPREKALNLALNNAHITGEFTTELGAILAELEVEIPDLAADLHLNEMYVDVPTDMDDLLGETETGENTGKDVVEDKIGKSVTDKEDGWENSDLRQIILILSTKEHEAATEILNGIMKDKNLESYTAAVMWLLREYEN